MPIEGEAMSRWWAGRLAFLVPAAAAGWAVLLAAEGRGRRIDASSFSRIRSGMDSAAGMTREEVYALLGGPPGDYTVFKVPRARPPWSESSPVLIRAEQRWVGDRGHLGVTFEDDKVSEVYWDASPLEARRPIDLLQHLLPRHLARRACPADGPGAASPAFR